MFLFFSGTFSQKFKYSFLYFDLHDLLVCSGVKFFSEKLVSCWSLVLGIGLTSLAFLPFSGCD